MARPTLTSFTFGLRPRRARGAITRRASSTLNWLSAVVLASRMASAAAAVNDLAWPACRATPARPPDSARLAGDAAQGDARFANQVALELPACGCGGQRKGERCAVARFDVRRALCQLTLWDRNVGHDLCLFERALNLGTVSLAAYGSRRVAAPVTVRGRVCERRRRGANSADRHVRGIGGDTLIADAEHGVHSRIATQGSAAGARFTLVASIYSDVAKVRTTRTLEQIAAHGGHVSNLRGSAG